MSILKLAVDSRYPEGQPSSSLAKVTALHRGNASARQAMAWSLGRAWTQAFAVEPTFRSGRITII